jgi:nicotinamidase-related amidase
MQNHPAGLSQSVVIIIDAQKEYQSGRLPLPGFAGAVAEIQKLLLRARANRVPVIHVAHTGKPGSPVFDPEKEFARIVDELKPEAGEIMVGKHFPNSFTQTSLDEDLKRVGRTDLIIVGFMTHMCVSSTVRQAAEKGYRCTVIAKACATRDLPDTEVGVVSASVIQASHLAAIADRFAVVLQFQDEIPD